MRSWTRVLHFLIRNLSKVLLQNYWLRLFPSADLDVGLLHKTILLGLVDNFHNSVRVQGSYWAISFVWACLRWGNIPRFLGRLGRYRFLWLYWKNCAGDSFGCRKWKLQVNRPRHHQLSLGRPVWVIYWPQKRLQLLKPQPVIHKLLCLVFLAGQSASVACNTASWSVSLFVREIGRRGKPAPAIPGLKCCDLLALWACTVVSNYCKVVESKWDDFSHRMVRILTHTQIKNHKDW